METQWQHVESYISWFYGASHLKVVPPVEGELPRPTNVEVLIEKEHARMLWIRSR